MVPLIRSVLLFFRAERQYEEMMSQLCSTNQATIIRAPMVTVAKEVKKPCIHHVDLISAMGTQQTPSAKTAGRLSGARQKISSQTVCKIQSYYSNYSRNQIPD